MGIAQATPELGKALTGLIAIAFAIVSASGAQAEPAGTFRAHPPGVLKDNYGEGVREYKQYAPSMRFPIAAPTTTVNSQLRNKGGMFYPGSECDQANYNEVFWDTYCEKRDGTHRSSICKSRAIHQGIDIRGGSSETCRALSKGQNKSVPVVAVFDGEIIAVSSYSVKLRTERGVFSYLHMDMRSLPYTRSELPKRVRAGDVIGYMDNDFGGSSTTFHLHLELRQPIAGKGITPVPFYCDLVLAYERHTGKVAEMVGGPRCDGASAPSVPPPPETTAGNLPPLPPVTTLPGSASPYQSIWTHGGSKIGLVAEGNTRKFVYLEPRAGLPAIVKPGTLVFEGDKIDNTYRGKAYVFNAGCGAWPYEVAGTIERGGARVVLKGPRPVPGPDDCNVARTFDDVLVFNFLSEQGRPIPLPESAPASPPVVVTAPATVPPSQAPIVTPAPPTFEAATTAKSVHPRCIRDTCIDRDAFVAAYSPYYKKLEGSDLNPYQVAALNSVINIWDTTTDLENVRRLAYILATVYHESFHLIYPIRECKCRDDVGSVACVRRLHAQGIASAYHRRDPKTRESYYGRGQTQLTLLENYARIGHNLSLTRNLVTDPDAALELDISARNAVLGLYHGWYRGNYALKRNEFASDVDWLRARDVLISQRRHADRVAAHGKKILPMLKPIARAEFDARYGSAGGTPPPTEPPIAVINSPASSLPPAPIPPPPSEAGLPPPATTPSPPSEPAMTDPSLMQLVESMRKLEQSAKGLHTQATELSQNASGTRSALEAYIASKTAAPKSAAAAAPEKDAGDMQNDVDFKTVWPPGHKALNRWCSATSGDAKSDMHLDKALDDDEEDFLSRYMARPLLPEWTGEGKAKAADDDEIERLSVTPLAPPKVSSAGAKSAALEPEKAWWNLPNLAKALDSGTTLKPLAPEPSR